ncbi:MAG TPA: 16S rRNA (uracil(1498)-N(3))-methyltransferase [Rhizomicrobium sp.]|nr:16S rRNA (uracil(1498)-N(3))-methyltransferase [Rhizomicrobium sp.]
MTEDITEAGGRLRLYVATDLGPSLTVPPSEAQTHYLLHVMRAKAGQRVSLFNGRDGEWLAEIKAASKRGLSLTCLKQTLGQAGVPDLWLAFAPIKKTPSDYLAQKATELGVSVLQPIFTRRTIVARVNAERMTANAVEAAEQSGRLSVPEIREAVSLEKLLAAWPKERRVFFCDEVGATATAGDAVPLAKAARAAPAAIFTGPEGGFDPAERDMLRAQSFVTPVTLGPRILRADTAALAALAIWQAVAGDWV